MTSPVRTLIATLLCFGTCVGPSAFAEPAQEPWRPLLVAAEQPASEAPNYLAWNKFVEAFSQRSGKRHQIAFTAIEQRGLDFLRRYVGYLLAQPLAELDRTQQLAWWLNLHNALVVYALSEQGATDLEAQRGTRSAPGPLWQRAFVDVGEIPMSLADMEALVVAGWGEDPRVVYGLYQGIRSGPELLHTAFTAAELDAQLTECAEQFVSDRTLVRVRKGVASVSPWLLWHRDVVFEGDAALLTHLGDHAGGRLGRRLRSAEVLQARKFDWSPDRYVAPRNNLDFGSAANAGFGS